MPKKARYTPAQILKALKKAGSNQGAAAALGVSIRTVDNAVMRAKREGKTPPSQPVDIRAAARVKKLQKELKRAQATSADAAALKEILGTARAKLDKTPVPPWTVKPIAAASAPGVPLLFLSDLHWGEVVFPTQLGGVNQYNLEIAHKRMDYTIETAIHLLEILDREMRYPGIVAALGGDMISGDIHEELATTNDLPTMPTVLNLRDKLIGALKRLADEFKRVFVPAVSGNHGRNTKKIQAKNRNHTSFDWLLYNLIAHDLRDDPRITFQIPDASDALFRVHNTRFLLTHGDQFRGGDGIIGPLGPLTRGNQKKLARNTAIDQTYDVMMCGHWHQYIHNERLIVNGSMKGYDEFAFTSNFGFEMPRQALFVVHERYGITFRMPVLCEKPSDRPKTGWVSIK
jgi:transposase/predicted phosphodiesterase